MARNPKNTKDMSNEWMDRQADRQTGRRTDRQTDGECVREKENFNNHFLGEETFIRRERSSLRDFFFRLNKLIHTITNSIYFLREQHVYSLMDQIRISEFVSLPH